MGETVNKNLLKSKRDPAIDFLRGIFIVLMALDHAAYFVGKSHVNEFWTGVVNAPVEAAVFTARILTHFCAPGFFFLAGFSVVLFAKSRQNRGWSNKQISLHFVKRGLLLIFLQIVIEDVAWALGSIADHSEMLQGVPGDGSSVLMHFGVLSAFGFVMIAAAVMYRFPFYVNALIFVLCVFLTHLAVWKSGAGDSVNPVIRLFAVPGLSNSMQVFYPVLPWLGVSAFGMASSVLYLDNRKKFAVGSILTGLSAIFTFVMLRLFTDAGSFIPYVSGEGARSFFSMSKYPPSAVFLLMTCGVCSLLFGVLLLVMRKNPGKFEPLTLFGSEPLFFYCAHLIVFLIIGIPFFEGAPFWAVVLCWIAGLAVMYPLVFFYKKYKAVINGRFSSLWEKIRGLSGKALASIKKK